MSQGAATHPINGVDNGGVPLDVPDTSAVLKVPHLNVAIEVSCGWLSKLKTALVTNFLLYNFLQNETVLRIGR